MSLHGGDWDIPYTKIGESVQVESGLMPVATWAAPAAPLSHLAADRLELRPLLGREYLLHPLVSLPADLGDSRLRLAP